MINLLQLEDFLDAETRERLLTELRAAGGAPAAVLSTEMGGRVQPSVRKVTRVAVSDETRALVQERLMARIEEIAAHFRIPIKTVEAPQFLRYEVGDFFVPHQDGNTPMVYDDSRFRRVSAVIFLNEQTEAETPGGYGGGDLVFHGKYNAPEAPVTAAAAPGTLVTFRSEITHEVTMVTHGVRFTIATWFR